MKYLYTTTPPRPRSGPSRPEKRRFSHQKAPLLASKSTASFPTISKATDYQPLPFSRQTTQNFLYKSSTFIATCNAPERPMSYLIIILYELITWTIHEDYMLRRRQIKTGISFFYLKTLFFGKTIRKNEKKFQSTMRTKYYEKKNIVRKNYYLLFKFSLY